MAAFKQGQGDWKQYRNLPNLMELDFHRADQESDLPYWAKMDEVWDDVMTHLQTAQHQGAQWLLITHGHSTSWGWKKTTARSQVRNFMRSKEATPYIIRAECIQHESVFVAAIRPAKNSGVDFQQV